MQGPDLPHGGYLKAGPKGSGAFVPENGKEPEKPFSGKTVIRIGSQLHQAAALKAQNLGISLNDFIKRAISAAVL